jgi:hypothetical protein
MVVETGSCTEIKSFWYTVREDGRAVAKRKVLLQLPDGEKEIFVDPREYPPSVALAELVGSA